MKDIWAIVAAVSGVLAVAVALLVFLADRSDKTAKLEIAHVSKTNLVNAGVPTAGRQIEIVFNGRKIPGYVVLQFRIHNVGGQPIRSTDFEAPVGITLRNVLEVLWADNTLSEPRSVKAPTKIDGTTVTIANTLMNPNDWMMLELAVIPAAGKSPEADPVGRVVGVRQVQFVPITALATADKDLWYWFKRVASITQAVLVLFAMIPMLWLMWRRRQRG